MGQGSTCALGSQGSEDTKTPEESARTADAVHRSDLCLGFESTSGRKNDPADDMEVVMENVEECTGICTWLEWLLGLAGRAKVVGNDGAESVEIGVDLLPEGVLGLRRMTRFLEWKVR